MNSKNFILLFSTALGLLLLSGCGDQTNEKVATETDIVENGEENSEVSETIETEAETNTEEENDNIAITDTYWDNVNIYFTKVDDALDFYYTNSAKTTSFATVRNLTEKLLISLNEAHETLLMINVPTHPRYQEYHQQLVDSLPRYIKSFENLLIYIPESKEDYANNPQLFDVAAQNVGLETGIYDDCIQELSEKRQALQVGL